MKTPLAYRFVGKARAAGFSLVSAIFLLVVLAGLGIAMVTLSSTQHQSTALDVQGVRAYQAARAGIEWGLFQRLQVRAGTGCFPNTHFALPAGSSLSGFTVTVTCSSTLSYGVDTAVITATACNLPTSLGVCDAAQAGSADYVERVLEARLSNDGV